MKTHEKIHLIKLRLEKLNAFLAKEVARIREWNKSDKKDRRNNDWI